MKTDVISTKPPSPTGSPDPDESSRDDIVVVWDRWSGWAHVASHRAGAHDLPQFLGIIQLPAATPDALRAHFALSGCRVMTEYNVDDQLIEMRIEVPLHVAGRPDEHSTATTGL